MGVDHNTAEEAKESILSAVQGIQTDHWMVVLFRIEGSNLMMDRTTSRFPVHRFVDCVRLLSENLKEEEDRYVELHENKQLPQDPLPLAPFVLPFRVKDETEPEPDSSGQSSTEEPIE